MEKIVLYASEGKILTDGVVYGKVIYLAKDVSPEIFYEITKEEYQDILARENEEQTFDFV